MVHVWIKIWRTRFAFVQIKLYLLKVECALLSILSICHDLKEDLMGTKFFIIFIKYVVYDWG